MMTITRNIGYAVLAAILAIGSIRNLWVGYRCNREQEQVVGKTSMLVSDLQRRREKNATAKRASETVKETAAIGAVGKAVSEAEGAPWRNLPEYARLELLAVRGRVARRYGEILNGRSMGDANRQKLADFLLRRMQAQEMAAREAQSSGTLPEDPTARHTFDRAAVSLIDNEIESAFGDVIYKQILDVDDGYRQQMEVARVAARLRYTEAPLSPEQRTRLIVLLRDATGPLGAADNPPEITDDIIAGAQRFLSDNQIKVLREYQQYRKLERTMLSYAMEKRKTD